jgi:hypothetical protein
MFRSGLDVAALTDHTVAAISGGVPALCSFVPPPPCVGSNAWRAAKRPPPCSRALRRSSSSGRTATSGPVARRRPRGSAVTAAGDVATTCHAEPGPRTPHPPTGTWWPARRCVPPPGLTLDLDTGRRPGFSSPTSAPRGCGEGPPCPT